MNKTLAALVFGTVGLVPVSIDALTIIPCPVRKTTIVEIPRVPRKSADKVGNRYLEADLPNRFTYGAKYYTTTKWEEGFCPITQTSGEVVEFQGYWEFQELEFRKLRLGTFKFF